MTRKRRPAGQTIGAILAGFDQQVFRATKPAAELVESAKPLPTVAASDGSMLSIDLPDGIADGPAKGAATTDPDAIE